MVPPCPVGVIALMFSPRRLTRASEWVDERTRRHGANRPSRLARAELKLTVDEVKALVEASVNVHGRSAWPAGNTSSIRPRQRGESSPLSLITKYLDGSEDARSDGTRGARQVRDTRS